MFDAACARALRFRFLTPHSPCPCIARRCFGVVGSSPPTAIEPWLVVLDREGRAGGTHDGEGSRIESAHRAAAGIPRGTCPATLQFAPEHAEPRTRDHTHTQAAGPSASAALAPAGAASWWLGARRLLLLGEDPTARRRGAPDGRSRAVGDSGGWQDMYVLVVIENVCPPCPGPAADDLPACLLACLLGCVTRRWRPARSTEMEIRSVRRAIDDPRSG